VEELHEMKLFKSSTAQEVQATDTRLPASYSGKQKIEDISRGH
jgi:hypothetical protein